MLIKYLIYKKFEQKFNFTSYFRNSAQIKHQNKLKKKIIQTKINCNKLLKKKKKNLKKKIYK
jgi:hypothetical protein